MINKWLGHGLLIFFGLLLIGVIVISGLTSLGFWFTYKSASALRVGDHVTSRASANTARGIFNITKVIWPSDMIILGQKLTNLELNASDLAPNVTCLIEPLVVGTGTTMCEEDISDLQTKVDVVNSDLADVEVLVKNIISSPLVKPLKLERYYTELMEMRKVTGRFGQLLGLWNEIMPKSGETKTYLVVFQNNAELWPTGGFMGSYAIIKIPFGKPFEYKIYDIYDADGQAPGHVNPPDEILHYLGDTGWFMRSANWSPDFPLTAKRLEWFLERNTQTKVDGVIGINMNLVQKILTATGPIKLHNGELITANNFFEKAEYASEINFFPGSKQKSQFLSQVAEVLLGKTLWGSNVNWFGLSKAINKGIEEKDVLVYLKSELAQKILKEAKLDGSITREDCGQSDSNCLMLVETNFGANKANYFIERDLKISQKITDTGSINTKVHAKWKNNSPNNSWPGGDYKDYVRWLVPAKSREMVVDLGDGRKATISGVLTAAVKNSVPRDQFLVVQGVEATYLSYGTFIKTPVKQERRLDINYQLPNQLAVGQPEFAYRFTLLKQPGIEQTKLKFSLSYPPAFEPMVTKIRDEGIRVRVLPGQLIYTMDQSTDWTLGVRFKHR